MTDHVIQQKLLRLSAGGRPRVLDLFAGCGGLSLGFHAQGFEISAAIENDPLAAASHGANFHGGDPKHSQARDITTLRPAQLVRELDLGRPAEAFDVIVGGPPCQAFARVGRSKLREIDAHPEAFKHDPRVKLYAPYLSYVKACRPLAILMENVPDVLNHGGHNIPEEVCEVLRENGYVCAYTLLNAAFYGVPQMRERMFLIACHEDVADAVSFPEPTHWVDLPPGYEGSRQVALKFLSGADITGRAWSYVPPPEAGKDLPPAITAHEAVGDLPPLDARRLLRAGTLRRGARRMDELIPYDRRRRVSEYARSMKEWPGFEAGEGLYDHVIRYLPRDYDLFARLNPGDQYPEAYRHALDMFEERLAELTKRGVRPKPGSEPYETLRRAMVPPYDAGKFPNKWRKMWRDQPARTLMAHLGKDSYSHIHYDSAQARTISVREAARLQSFPDGFRFEGTMNPSFRQIGNAVPPLMAKAIAGAIRAAISDAAERSGDVLLRTAAAF
ncbi:MAG: DNA cytosine methyltransferase [Halieaceae bacterium]|jgi:DNA (cytosine-5)-methyltransferase 1|nr:DNA cytosine methyltransferase [Halieaceae bacterium]